MRKMLKEKLAEEQAKTAMLMAKEKEGAEAVAPAPALD